MTITRVVDDLKSPLVRSVSFTSSSEDGSLPFHPDGCWDFVFFRRDGQTLESNDLVASVVAGQPKAATERTMQRQFLKTTGLTYKHAHVAVFQKADDVRAFFSGL